VRLLIETELNHDDARYLNAYFRGVLYGDALQITIDSGYESMSRLHVENGAGFDSYPLHAVKKHGYEAIIRFLVKKGAEFNANDGGTHFRQQ
jgi:hypothetical protein